MHCPFMVVCLWVLVHSGPNIFLYTMIRDVFCYNSVVKSSVLGIWKPFSSCFFGNQFSYVHYSSVADYALGTSITLDHIILFVVFKKSQGECHDNRNYQFCSSVVSFVNVFHIPFFFWIWWHFCAGYYLLSEPLQGSVNRGGFLSRAEMTASSSCGIGLLKKVHRVLMHLVCLASREAHYFWILTISGK